MPPSATRARRGDDACTRALVSPAILRLFAHFAAVGAPWGPLNTAGEVHERQLIRPLRRIGSDFWR